MHRVALAECHGTTEHVDLRYVKTRLDAIEDAVHTARDALGISSSWLLALSGRIDTLEETTGAVFRRLVNIERRLAAPNLPACEDDIDTAVPASSRPTRSRSPA